MTDRANESLRRQLKFSLFLQGAAFVMFGIAFVARTFSSGLDALSIAFALLTIVCAGAFVVTRSKMRQLG